MENSERILEALKKTKAGTNDEIIHEIATAEKLPTAEVVKVLFPSKVNAPTALLIPEDKIPEAGSVEKCITEVVHPTISEQCVELVAELAALESISISAVVDAFAELDSTYGGDSDSEAGSHFSAE
ncbi:uncharacterized protein LOC119675313 [Teleopsis dalmanni]|uniref:uncharacterized protein LOC119675313 n=1 Tax=Teleopsis dalmanni TaxID=139649 RepID=UPI0018CCE8FF|nr:uncharacterized protein LOC119675313 [Teleopsis dalmanni]